jgi:hypothetical protein
VKDIKLSNEDINRLSPTRYGHVNPYGIYPFDIEKESNAQFTFPPDKIIVDN